MKLSTKSKFLLYVAGIAPLGAANIINIDATGLTAQTGIASINNTGTAGGTFGTVTGSVDVAPAGGINGLVFDGGSKMNSSFLTNSLATPMTGNQAHSAQAWVFNPGFGAEEAIVAWGRRGGPDGSNVGFHQGNHGSFGAVGHWGGGGGTETPPTTTPTTHSSTPPRTAGLTSPTPTTATNPVSSSTACSSTPMTTTIWLRTSSSATAPPR